MRSGLPQGGICLSHSALLPREIRAPRSRHKDPDAADQGPHWGERELIALDVFDGSMRRAEALCAQLHASGFDITTVSGNLAALRSLRGDLAFAFRGRHTDLLERLQKEIGDRFETLCSSFSSLKQDRYAPPVPGYRRSGQDARELHATLTTDPASCKNAMTRGLYA